MGTNVLLPPLAKAVVGVLLPLLPSIFHSLSLSLSFDFNVRIYDTNDCPNLFTTPHSIPPIPIPPQSNRYKRTHDIPSSPPAPGPHISQDHRDIARVEQSHMTITSPLPLAPTANKAQDGLHLQADARVYDCDYFERKHSLAHTSSPLSLSLSQSRSPFSNSDGLGLSNSPGRVSDPKSPLRSGARKKNKSESEMREEGSSPPSAVLCSDADAASDLPGGYAGRDSAAADEGRDGEEEEEEEEEDDDGLFEGLGVAPGEGEGEYAALGEDYYSDSSSSHHCSSDEEEDEQAPAVEADTREVEPQTEAQMHLPVGIVDYVLMFAPPQSQPTGNINGDNSVDGVGTGDQTERDIERVNRGTPGSAHSSGKRGSGMFPSSHNATNNAHNAVGSTYSPANINENAYAYTSSAFEGGVLEGLSPVRLQSRFPHHDHADSPVPDSVEWFAAPRGCVYRTSQKRSQRPPPSKSEYKSDWHMRHHSSSCVHVQRVCNTEQTHIFPIIPPVFSLLVYITIILTPPYHLNFP